MPRSAGADAAQSEPSRASQFVCVCGRSFDLHHPPNQSTFRTHARTAPLYQANRRRRLPTCPARTYSEVGRKPREGTQGSDPRGKRRDDRPNLWCGLSIGLNRHRYCTLLPPSATLRRTHCVVDCHSCIGVPTGPMSSSCHRLLARLGPSHPGT